MERQYQLRYKEMDDLLQLEEAKEAAKESSAAEARKKRKRKKQNKRNLKTALAEANKKEEAQKDKG